MANWFSNPLPLTFAVALALAPAALAADDELAADAQAQILVAEAEVIEETGADEPAGLRIIDASDVDLDSFLWEWRVVAVVANTPNDPAFIQQMREIEARAEYLFERDVVVVTDSDARSGSELRQRLRPRGFMLAIIEKDGAIAQRRPSPRDAREIAAIIDRFPLRRQEMLERLPGR
jgi:hypothetical protein